MKITHPYQDHYMKEAFLGFVSFASKNLMDQYEAEQVNVNLATDPMGRMVDKATGHDQAEAQKFIDWCVVQFGTPDQIDATTTGDAA